MAQQTANSSQRIGIAVAVVVVVIVIVFVWMRPREAQVSGVVTFDSVALADAQIVFIGDAPQNQSPVVTHTDQHGKYQLVGNMGDGVPIGKYRVTVNKMALKDGTVPMGEDLEKARVDGLLLNILPEVYADQTTTTLQIELSGGSNTINLELKKQP